MIVCPNCNHPNPDGAVQCEACYTPLPATSNCPSCGATVQADAAFCSQCGYNLRSSVPAAATVVVPTIAPETPLVVPPLAPPDPLLEPLPSNPPVVSPLPPTEVAVPNPPTAPPVAAPEPTVAAQPVVSGQGIPTPPPEPIAPPPTEVPEPVAAAPEPPYPALQPIEPTAIPKTSKKLARYPYLDCQDKILIRHRFSLFVQLLIEPPEPNVQVVEVDDTELPEQLPEVEVVLRASGFDIEDSNTKVMQINRDEESEVRFVLSSYCIGEQQIRVDFYQHDRRIGTVRRNVLVVAQPTNANVTQPAKQLTSLVLKTEAVIPPADLELCIELHDQQILVFTLHSKIAAYHHTKCGAVKLNGSPLEKMQTVYTEMSHLANPIKPTEQAAAARRLDTVGRQLWDELIPDKLKQEYWKFKHCVKSILVTSDEPWMPWEIIKPYRYNDNGNREDEPFWCQQFALSRWLSGPITVDEFLIAMARPIAPAQVNLPSVQEEVIFIQHLRNLRSDITVLEPFSTCQEVLDCLENETVSILHFACHGMFDATFPDNSAIKLSDGILRPSDIQIKFGGRRPRPLLFMNACHGARSDFSFTGLGGWAKRLVTDASVGAFIGAMWEVNDALALRFAQSFYTAWLKDKQTIAEALRQAREEIRQLAPYNSTWLAYSLYAEPEGRCRDCSLPDTVSLSC